jgi:subfamily B ATP-binding cassette protein MsbA
MRDYLRVLRMLGADRPKLTALIVCIIIASILSTLGVTFVSPLLRILFEENPAQTEMVVEAPAEEAPGQDPDSPLALAETVESLKDRWVNRFEAWFFTGTKMDQLWRLCFALLLVYTLRNLFAFFQEALRVSLEQHTIHRLREQLYREIQRLPLGFFSSERTGYLMSRVIVDVDMMRGAIVGVFKDLLSNGLMAILALVIAALMSWKLLLTTLLVVPPNMLLVAWISRRLRRGSNRVQEEMGGAASALQEMISGIRIVKAFDVDGIENRRFHGVNEKYTRAYIKLKVTSALSSPVSEVLGIITAVVIIAVGGRLVIEGQLRPDALGTFLGVMLWVIGPIKKMIKANSTLQESLAASRRVFMILDATKEGEATPATRAELPPLRDALVFDGVNFEYESGTPVLKNIELRVGAGEVVALVGPSGAGKSTLVDLVPRFHDPTRGRVTIDGVDLREFELGALRKQIGVVSQEVILFHDTVARNIAFGAGEVEREAVESAARTANAHEFIASLPRGYDTVIGERGLQLSGGQRQRLAIARAVLKNPPYLILDEATSALDTESERMVQEAMERLMKGRTTLVIAHRLSTVTRADCIVVMQDGRIVERGTHDELLAQEGAYRRLYELQFTRSGNDDAGDSPELAR